MEVRNSNSHCWWIWPFLLHIWLHSTLNVLHSTNLLLIGRLMPIVILKFKLNRMPWLVEANCLGTTLISRVSCSTFHSTPKALSTERLSRSQSNGCEIPGVLRMSLRGSWANTYRLLLMNLVNQKPPLDKSSVSWRASWPVSSSEGKDFKRSSM